MLNPENTNPFGAAHLPLIVAADLQDNLMTASNDLDRLQALLAHACDELMVSFHGASEHIRAIDPSGDTFEAVLDRLGGAITALQFQDMASQLIAHTNRRLQSCAGQIARVAMGDDEDGVTAVEPPPQRPNPVTQNEMDAGSIELF